VCVCVCMCVCVCVVVGDVHGEYGGLLQVLLHYTIIDMYIQ
jgi:hypothetical protein